MPELRSLDSAVSGRGAGKVRVVCQGRGGWKSLGALAQSIDKARKHGYRLRPSQPKLKLSRWQATRAALGELRARAAVRVQRDPARGQRLGQQRPGRRPAGRLHRAHLARAAAQRPALRPTDPEGLGRRQDAELPLPGHLPQRPEPDPHPGPRGARHPAAQPAAEEPSGHPRPRPLRALQPPARGQRRAADRRDHRRRLRLRVGRPRGAAAHLPQARDRARGPRRRVRGAQLHRARSARARPLRRGDRRLPDRHGEDVLGRRLRQPDLHLRPRPLHRLRRVRRRRRRRSTRAPPPRPASRPTCRSIRTRRASTPRSATATCAAACSRTRARWATPCGSPTTTSTATPPASRPTRSRPAAIPATRPTASRSTTTASTPTTSTCSSRTPPVRAGRRHPAVRRRHLLGRPQQRPGARQLDLGQLAQRRVPALDPRLPGHARGQHQPGRLVQEHRRCPPRAATASSTTTWAACPRASSPSPSCTRSATTWAPTRGVAPNGVDFWWDEGGLGIGHRQLLVQQPRPRRDARERDRPGRRGRQRRAAVRLHEQHARATP